MSQRKAAAEQMLEKLENWLGRGARMLKLLEILTVKIDLISNPTVKHTALEDINEMRKIIRVATMTPPVGCMDGERPTSPPTPLLRGEGRKIKCLEGA